MAKLAPFGLQIAVTRTHSSSQEESSGLHIDFGQFVRENQLDVVQLGAVAGFLVGLFLWGSVTLGIMAGIDSLMGAESTTLSTQAVKNEPLNCANFGAVRALSPDDEARYQAQCGSTQPIVLEEPAGTVATSPQAAASSEASATNRASCDEIRGTDYRSDAERTWYLANCVTQ